VNVLPAGPDGLPVGGRGSGIPGHELIVDGGVDTQGESSGDDDDETCQGHEPKLGRIAARTNQDESENRSEDRAEGEEGKHANKMHVEDLLLLNELQRTHGAASVGGAHAVSEEDAGHCAAGWAPRMPETLTPCAERAGSHHNQARRAWM